jgi:predicted phosphodiesterase
VPTRVFALSDVHVDYECNARWIASLSSAEFRDDVLILAGDVSDSLSRLEWTLCTLAARFDRVLFVPGNHELWIVRDRQLATSLDKFERVRAVVEQSGASMDPFHRPGLSVVPLLGWYDYSFGEPSAELLDLWADYRACRWPAHFDVPGVAQHFAGLNHRSIGARNATVLTFSHFLPRTDLAPRSRRDEWAVLFPVLGSVRLDAQIRALGSTMHVYGHSHVNRRLEIDGVTYINNAFGYPHETRCAAKRLLCIHSA